MSCEVCVRCVHVFHCKEVRAMVSSEVGTLDQMDTEHRGKAIEDLVRIAGQSATGRSRC